MLIFPRPRCQVRKWRVQEAATEPDLDEGIGLVREIQRARVNFLRRGGEVKHTIELRENSSGVSRSSVERLVKGAMIMGFA
jgi:hypothetical protein